MFLIVVDNLRNIEVGVRKYARGVERIDVCKRPFVGQSSINYTPRRRRNFAVGRSVGQLGHCGSVPSRSNHLASLFEGTACTDVFGVRLSSRLDISILTVFSGHLP